MSKYEFDEFNKNDDTNKKDIEHLDLNPENWSIENTNEPHVNLLNKENVKSINKAESVPNIEANKPTQYYTTSNNSVSTFAQSSNISKQKSQKKALFIVLGIVAVIIVCIIITVSILSSSSSIYYSNDNLDYYENYDTNSSDDQESFSDDDQEIIPLTMQILDVTPYLYNYFKVPIGNVYSTSELLEAEYDYSSFYIIDDDDSTYWSESVLGNGECESVNIYFEDNDLYNIKYIGFKLGNWETDESYYENSRPKILKISVDDKITEYITFSDIKEEQWVELSEPISSNYITVEIIDVYSGLVYTDTCINEIEFFAEY